MSFSHILSLLGGIAIFMFGMSIMSTGLERFTGGKLEKVLSKMTSNIFMGVLLGAVITAIDHSSAATTIMVVGFVNAGMLDLKQACGVIMGANIGTTVTAQILRLGAISSDNILLQLMQTSNLGPLLCIMGVVLYLFIVKGKCRNIGQILIGLGMLFTAMGTMEMAVSPLKDSPAFADLLMKFTNPVLGVLVGALVTALIQSSTASVALLTSFSATGSLTFAAGIPIIMGQNVGTCITALISAIGATKNAKRASMIHLFFNLIGSLFFLLVIYLIKFIVGIPFWNDVMNQGDIANFHLCFNLACTLLWLPLNKVLVKLAILAVGDKGQAKEVTVLDERFLETPSIALDVCHQYVCEMAGYARINYSLALDCLKSFDEKKHENLCEQEQTLDKMESQLSNYLLRLTKRHLSTGENGQVSNLLHAMGDFERVGDYVTNVDEIAQKMKEQSLHFDERTLRELSVLNDAVSSILTMSIDAYSTGNATLASKVEPLEQVIDVMKDILKNRHIERLKDDHYNAEAGAMMLELLINLERISDHCSAVAVGVIQQYTNAALFNSHEYLRHLHEGSDKDYNDAYNEYQLEYLSRIIAEA